MNPLTTPFLKRTIVCLVGLLAAGTIGAGTANADPVRASCLTIPPHVTLTFGANTPKVWAQSGGTNYATYPCYRFVTDIVVPPDSSGGLPYKDEFTLGWRYGAPWELPFSQSECAAYDAYFSIYKRTFLGTDFTLVGGGSMHGEWVIGNCVAAHDPGWVALPDTFDPPTWLTTTYRLAVGAKLNTWKQVSTEARHVPVNGVS
jgi:hypothetical protein